MHAQPFGVGRWRADLRTGRVTLDAEASRLATGGLGALELPLDAFEALHPLPRLVEPAVSVFPVRNRVVEARTRPELAADGALVAVVGVDIDVSESHAAASRLTVERNHSRQHLAALAHVGSLATLCIVRWAPDGTVLWCNDGFAALLGSSPSVLLGSSWADAFAASLPETSGDQPKCIFDELTNAPASTSLVSSLHGARRILWSSSLDEDRSAVTTVGLDTTELSQTHTALQAAIEALGVARTDERRALAARLHAESAQLLLAALWEIIDTPSGLVRSAFEALASVIDELTADAPLDPLDAAPADAEVLYDGINPPLWQSKAAFDVLGRDITKLTTLERASFIHPDDLTPFSKAVYAALAGSHPSALLIRYQHPLRSWRWLHVTARPAASADGPLARVTYRDDTAMITATAAPPGISAPEGLVGLDPTGFVHWATPLAVRFFGLDPTGHRLIDALAAVAEPASLDQLVRVLAGDRAVAVVHLAGSPARLTAPDTSPVAETATPRRPRTLELRETTGSENPVVAVRDVTETSAHRARLATVFDVSPVRLGLLDEHGTWVLRNPVLVSNNYSGAAAAGAHPDDIAGLLDAFGKLRSRASTHEARLARFRNQAGGWDWMWAQAVPVDLPDACVALSSTDVTALLAALGIEPPTGPGVPGP